MSLSARDFIVREQMAKDADTIIPPIPISGRSYRNPNIDKAAVASGNQYDQLWESSKNNQVDYEVSGLAKHVGKMGLAVWSPLEDYIEGSVQMGTDERVYRCNIPHGPNTEDVTNPGANIGPKDPTVEANVGDDNYWVDFGEWLLKGGSHGSYEAIPNTLAKRDPLDGRTQVADPKEDLDATNKRWVQNYVHTYGGTGNVAKPEILAPEDDAMQQSLSFQIEISEIESISGGELTPLFTRFRVLSENNAVIYSTAEMPYTTTPEVSVPAEAIGQRVRIIVQYETVDDQVSAWSDAKIVRIASPLANPAAVTIPPRGSMNIVPGPLSVELDEGSWSDGSAFSGSQSRVELFDEATGQSLYDSGWVGYATEFELPGGLLANSKAYWLRGQHKASAAPAANPDAILTTPVVYRDSLAASYFYTIGPTPPNIGNMTHTIPGLMLQGTQKTFTITGANSLDGGAITYDLVNIGGGLSFSKYSGIAEGEEVEIYAPTTSLPSINATVSIVAKSSSGSSASPVAVRVVIASQLYFVFDKTTSWKAPFAGRALVEAGGAGGGARQVSSRQASGGGGGYASMELNIEEGFDYTIIVGTGGRTGEYGGAAATDGGFSSFHSHLFAYGGGAASDSIGGVGGSGAGAVVYKGGNGRGTGNPSGNSYATTTGGGGAGGDGDGKIGNIVVQTSSAPQFLAGGESGGPPVHGDSPTGKNAPNSYASSLNSTAEGGKGGVAGGGGSLARIGAKDLPLPDSLAYAGDGSVVVTYLV